MSDIDAVAVAIGPGSYTGLRVGLASAKGFCYALQKPLIAINTLEIITLATIETLSQYGFGVDGKSYCPMIDARRMEVFTATFNSMLEMVDAPTAMVLDENSFLEKLNNNEIIFSGNGMPKFKTICHHPNAIFIDVKYGVKHLAELAERNYQAKRFEDVAYIEPFYAKSFYSTQPIKINT